MQRDTPPRAAAQLMARQDQGTAQPVITGRQTSGPAQVASSDWVERDRQARAAQQAARVSGGQPMPELGATSSPAGPTVAETQAVEAMRRRMMQVWGIAGEPSADVGIETRDGRLRAWTAELPGKGRGREEEREP